MLLNFSIRNFGSIKDEQTLSMEADKSTHLEDTYVINANKHRILKIALIYGANASGKTTILRALDFLRSLVLSPERLKTDTLDFNPYLFDCKTPNLSSEMSIEFIQNNKKYFYRVEFTKQAIISEELNFIDLEVSNRYSNIFKRTSDIEKQISEITFGNKFSQSKSIKEAIETNTLWNNTVLGGFLKVNIELSELDDVILWFRNYLNPMITSDKQLQFFITSKIAEKKISKIDILNILKEADLNISNILLKEKDDSTKQEFIELMQFLMKRKDLPNEFIDAVSSQKLYEPEFEHLIDGNRYTLPIELESLGTQRYYVFAGLLVELIKSSTLYPIDEIEASLHPDLLLHFILTFLQNSKSSQIIATTHNREILNDKDLFRNDAIWFTNKEQDAATELYSLADFDTKDIRNTTNILNAYKIGKLSGIPKLGYTFIDIEK